MSVFEALFLWLIHLQHCRSQ